jgi:hypothetical protein
MSGRGGRGQGAGVQEFRSSGVQEFRSSGVQEFRSSGVQDHGGKSKFTARVNCKMGRPKDVQASSLFCNS